MAQQRWLMRINGRVQGVYYRASAKYKAADLGVTGYAKNLSDGRVEVVAEGEEAALNEMLEWCWQGPPNAEVTNIECEKAAATPYYDNFQIFNS
ncbi:acylphosphatase [Marinobacter caseinilyticus]|uniref:acylphosphatase n=1 Tax=Marinobacter caseinilyticus TaxID=2692195 RepID=UPI001408B50C|nr:acylphosphatase [Marinobacter caseinilyticus]